MTTQPSDWAIATAWRAATATRMTPDGIEYVTAVGVEYINKRARELDASGGGVEPVAWISPRGDLIDNERFQSRLNGLPDFGDLSGYRPLYATPRAAEAGDDL